jgi:hypothetical protein
MEFRKGFLFTKVDAARHVVSGIGFSSAVDRQDESGDYDLAKRATQAYSIDAYTSTTRAGQEANLGGIRVGHSMQIGGKAKTIEYDDNSETINIESEPVNDEIWDQIERGFLRGYSVGGSYAWRKCAVDGTEITDGSNFCPTCQKKVIVKYGMDRVAEYSYVDTPANPEAVFEYIKSDGARELRKFAPIPPAQKEDSTMHHLEHAKLDRKEGDLWDQQSADGSPEHRAFCKAMAEHKRAHARLHEAAAKTQTDKAVAAEFMKEFFDGPADGLGI